MIDRELIDAKKTVLNRVWRDPDKRYGEGDCRTLPVSVSRPKPVAPVPAPAPRAQETGDRECAVCSAPINGERTNSRKCDGCRRAAESVSNRKYREAHKETAKAQEIARRLVETPEQAAHRTERNRVYRASGRAKALRQARENKKPVVTSAVEQA